MKENYKTIQMQYTMQTGIEESVVFFLHDNHQNNISKHEVVDSVNQH